MIKPGWKKGGALRRGSRSKTSSTTPTTFASSPETRGTAVWGPIWTAASAPSSRPTASTRSPTCPRSAKSSRNAAIPRTTSTAFCGAISSFLQFRPAEPDPSDEIPAGDLIRSIRTACATDRADKVQKLRVGSGFARSGPVTQSRAMRQPALEKRLFEATGKRDTL